MPNDYFGLGGHVIDGQFHAIEVAGEGGFSVVYRGQHLSLREPIAIKCLKLQVKLKDPAVVASFTQRFFDESRIMYRLSQGNLDIARSVTSGVTMAPATGATVPYMVLEWLDGVSLATDLKDRRAQKLEGRALHEVMAMFEPAALAVGYAHSQGVVHRDIKPGNLFLHARREGMRMKVLDFGMAKVLSPEAMGGIESAATLSSVMVVSPQYVTPEQLETRAGKIGPWTDVYSFALIMSEALADRRARDATTFADLVLQVTKQGLPTPRGLGVNVSDAVEGVFARALARNPAERHQDMNAFWTDLTRAAAEPQPTPSFAQTKVMPESLPPEVREYLAQHPHPTNLGGTMPLAPTQAPAAQRRPFSGTLPLQAASPQPPTPPAMPPQPQLSPRAHTPVSVPELAPPPPAPEPLPLPPPPQQMPQQAMEPSPPRTSPALVVFLVLFVLLALSASGLFLYRALILHR